MASTLQTRSFGQSKPQSRFPKARTGRKDNGLLERLTVANQDDLLLCCVIAV